MSNDPQGPDENAESNDFAAAEDFLGLQADSNGRDPEASEPTLEAGFPAEPELIDGIYDPLAQTAANDGIYDPGLEPDESSSLFDPMVETEVEDALEVSTDEASLDGDESAAEEEFDLDFDEEGASWLMEFDGAESDEEQEEAFAQAFEEGGEELDDDFRPSLAEPEPVGASSPWLGRAILAVVSVAVGVVGSKFIASSQFGADQPAETEIARVDPSSAGKNPGQPAQNKAAATNANGKDAAPGAATSGGGGKPAGNKPLNNGKPVPVAKETTPQVNPGADTTPQGNVALKPTGPAPGVNPPKNSGGADGPVKPGQVPATVAQVPVPEVEPSGIVIQVGDTGMVGDSAPVELVPSADSPLMEGGDGRLRQASPKELASIWTGDTIPREAVHGNQKLLTPAVGEVRVLLYAGEIFEGKLYAVGNRRIWLETKIGKMALLEWQIDSYEKIADSTTLALGSARTVAGLQSVRVRTVGGVFYGKLVSHKGSTVTIITASGARLTLEDAELATAGRSASHLVDSSKLVVAKTDSE